MTEQPPRRLLLAYSLADKADYSEIRFNSNEYYPQGLIVAHLSAWVGNRSKKYVAMVPFQQELKEYLSDEVVKPRLKSAIVRALAENPNVTKPKGRLPR